MAKPPLLRKSALTGNWYIITGYRQVTPDHIAAGVKTDVTGEVREMLAIAWQEGYRSGHSRAMRLLSDEPKVKPGKNPYRDDTDG